MAQYADKHAKNVPVVTEVYNENSNNNQKCT